MHSRQGRVSKCTPAKCPFVLNAQCLSIVEVVCTAKKKKIYNVGVCVSPLCLVVDHKIFPAAEWWCFCHSRCSPPERGSDPSSPGAADPAVQARLAVTGI